MPREHKSPGAKGSLCASRFQHKIRVLGAGPRPLQPWATCQQASVGQTRGTDGRLWAPGQATWRRLKDHARGGGSGACGGRDKAGAAFQLPPSERPPPPSRPRVLLSCPRVLPPPSCCRCVRAMDCSLGTDSQNGCDHEPVGLGTGSRVASCKVTKAIWALVST